MYSTRRRLTAEATAYRASFFENGRIPSEAEKSKMLKDIRAMPECAWYDAHTHSNFCKPKEHSAEAQARVFLAERLKSHPLPNVVDIFRWQRELNTVSGEVVFRIIWDLLDPTLKAQGGLLYFSGFNVGA